MLGVQSESATPLLRPGTGGTNYAVGGYHTEQIFNSISGNSNPAPAIVQATSPATPAPMPTPCTTT